METLSNAILRISEVGEKRLGETTGEWNIFRAPFGMAIVLDCSNRGALFESLTVIRILLEQLAWSIAAILEKDGDRVSQISAQSSMRFLKKLVPASGRFYGWLSDHAHWQYDAHVKGLTIEEGRLGHLFASAHFKAVAMSAALVMTLIYLRSLDQLMRSSQDEDVSEHTLRLEINESQEKIKTLLWRAVNLQPEDTDLASLATIAC